MLRSEHIQRELFQQRHFVEYLANLTVFQSVQRSRRIRRSWQEKQRVGERQANSAREGKRENASAVQEVMVVCAAAKCNEGAAQ